MTTEELLLAVWLDIRSIEPADGTMRRAQREIGGAVRSLDPREYQRVCSETHRLRNLEKLRQAARQYQIDHKQQRRAYLESHRDIRRKWSQRYRDSHPEQVKASTRAYDAAHRAQRADAQRRRRHQMTLVAELRK